MDRGNFDASQLFKHGQDAKASSDADDMKDVYTTGGLRAILGVGKEQEGGDIEESLFDDAQEKEGELSAEQMEKTMTQLEDADDVQALRGVQKEAAEELREFDESVEIKKAADSDDEEGETNNDPKLEEIVEEKNPESMEEEKSKEEELEKEFASWQDNRVEVSVIEASLSPTERYALRFREFIDPFYSTYAIMEYQRKLEAEQEGARDDEIDIDELEKINALEEQQAIEDGDLLATRPRPEDLIRQRTFYLKEKARLRANKKRRKLTGEDWEPRTDAVTNLPFWYNVDTGEALWDKPSAVLEIEAYEIAYKHGFAELPLKPLLRVMSFLSPFPDRMNCAVVCKQWRKASNHPSFVRHVYPVEMGAYTRDEKKLDANHYRTLSDAIAAACPGDTIGKSCGILQDALAFDNFCSLCRNCKELGDGHYWANADLIVDFPLKLVGDEGNPSNVIIEMGGTLFWRGKGGWCEGITFRRPKLASEELADKDLLRIEGQGCIHIIHSVLDNESSTGHNVYASGPGKKGSWQNVIVKGGGLGIVVKDGATLELSKVRHPAQFISG